MTKRERFIIKSLKIEPSIAKIVSEIGRIAGTHKYDFWIAREAKKDNNILSNTKDIYFIIDWAKKEKPDILTISLPDAYLKAEKWHKSAKFSQKLKRPIEETNEERIIFKCSDKQHFFLLLKPEELKTEGSLMNHCVASYKEKVKTGRSLIVSLRDKSNMPHVTIEIDTKTGTVVQMRGNSNSEPSEKYRKMIVEFAMYASGYSDGFDKELLDLMQMNFE